MKTQSFEIKELKELIEPAKFISELAKTNSHFCLEAPMGAGKTTLISALCKRMGVTETTSSPTFSLVNTYKSPQGAIYHFDFYRLNNEEEAYNIGVEDYFHTDAWCFIEWPSVIKNLLPLITNNIYLTKLDDDQRNIQLK